MITITELAQIADRVTAARRGRCGGNEFAMPPSDWPRILHEAWPSVWDRPQWSITVGLVDMAMAMSEHLAELDPEARIIDAFHDYLSGGLFIRASFVVPEVRDIVGGYEHYARNRCSECGAPGYVRELIGFSDVRQIRCENHLGGTR